MIYTIVLLLLGLMMRLLYQEEVVRYLFMLRDRIMGGLLVVLRFRRGIYGGFWGI